MNTAPGVLSSRSLSSIPASASSVAPVQKLLGYVDALPSGAIGALSFGDQGVILIESRKICWAAARSTRRRLTDILRHQSSPPLPREDVERIYRACIETGRPIGEALVASGLATEAGLRAALLKHNGEALIALAASGVAPTAFVVHSKTGYDPKYAFTPCEMLARLGALDDLARATAAQLELNQLLVAESVGAAFVRRGTAAGAIIIAVSPGCDFAVGDLLGVCNWSSSLFDVARTCDPDIFAARANWGDKAGLVTWRIGEVGYLGLCSSRAAAARLVSALSERAAQASGVLSCAAPREGGPP
jgi:hypothetical protein